jgi:LAO/AO transport system kinase
MSDLARQLRTGDRRALARLLTQIQDETQESTAALIALYPHTGHAHRIGITGAPGTGKSSLVSSLAKHYRAAGRTVGIIAVDPTSPFSGGAVLGDRIRMRDLSGDPGVFIRSMATRGSLGGLARATGDSVHALDAAGFDVILIETVGAGQSEVDIAREAHTTLVVEAPGLGDDVQAIKAGILEIADILVVNKVDRPDAQNAVRALRAMLDLGSDRPSVAQWHHGQLLPPEPAEPDAAASARDGGEDQGWTVPILETVAPEAQGIPALVEAIDAHREYLHASGQLTRWTRHHVERDLAARLQDALLARFLRQTGPDRLRATIDRLVRRELDPLTAVAELLGQAGAEA